MSETVSPDISAACSFCGRKPQDVGHLFAGPRVWICDNCVTACYGILQQLPAESKRSSAGSMDPTMSAIAKAQQAALDGAIDQAKAGFLALWDKTNAEGPPLHRATIGHYLADIQDDPEEELLWNQRALEAARAARPGDDAVLPLLASLHLNTAQSLYRLGRLDAALQHLNEAERAQEHLPQDGYGHMLHEEIATFREQLDTQPPLVP